MLKIMVMISFVFFSGVSMGAGKILYTWNGNSYEGYLEKAKGKSKGVVIIIHDWDGLTDYEEKRAQMLSKEGYDAFAIDLYGKGNRPVDAAMKKEETGKLYNDREKMRNLILAGISESQKHVKGKTFVMGYCFGGAAVLELARSGKAPFIAGFATFHGGLQTPEGQKYTTSAPIFIAHGGADAGISMDEVSQLSKELEAANIEYDIEVYSGAPHAFTVFGSDRYNKHADQKSWNSFLRFVDSNRI